MMVITDSIRRLVMQRADAGTIKNEAEKQGMTNLRQDGVEKIIAGLTSIPEVLRVTQDSAG